MYILMSKKQNKKQLHILIVQIHVQFIQLWVWASALKVTEEFKELYRFGTARLTCIPELLLQDVLQAAEHRFVLSWLF